MNISFAFIVLTFCYVVFQALVINMHHSSSLNITSNVGPYRFYDVAINIRYTVGVIFSSSNHLFCDPHHLKVNPKPLFHGYTQQFQNMNFQTWGSSISQSYMCACGIEWGHRGSEPRKTTVEDDCCMGCTLHLASLQNVRCMWKRKSVRELSKVSTNLLYPYLFMLVCNCSLFMYVCF